MRHQLQVDLIVVGGGCAGLWTVYDFAKRGFRCALLEHGSLARYASQGNQSWLHSGALYGVLESEQPPGSPLAEELRATARECRKGYTRLQRFARRHCKGALDNRSECMFLYDDEVKADRAFSMLRSYGLEPRVYRSNLELLEPILAGSQASIALVTKDIPFDAARMLNAVTRRASDWGASFLNTQSPLEDIRIFRDGANWVVEDDSISITAQVVVCATGVLVLRQRTTLGFVAAESTIQKCKVAVLDSRICNRILAFRIQAAQGLNIVPFRGGTTLNIGTTDQETENLLDRVVPNSDTMFESLSDVLSLYTPAISKWRIPIRAHSYVCQKVGNPVLSSRPRAAYGKRHFFWLAAEPSASTTGLFYAYPGKFTLSANCSRELFRHIQSAGLLGEPNFPRNQGVSKLAVGRSPYHEESTQVLATTPKGELRFVPRYI